MSTEVIVTSLIHGLSDVCASTESLVQPWQGCLPKCAMANFKCANEHLDKFCT